MPVSSITLEEVRRAREAALENAESILRAEQLLDGRNLEHIRYHLATLCLEEIGKAQLISMRHVANLHDEEDQPRFFKHFDDHEKKLFWAFWGGTFGSQTPTVEIFNDFNSLAQRIHRKRLEFLYANPEDGVPPSQKVTAEEVDQLVGLARVGLASARAHPLTDTHGEPNEAVRWFLDAADDPRLRQFIFAPASLEKLAELGDAKAWLAWVRDSLSAQQARDQELLEQELQRSRPTGVEATKPKWSLKFRLYSHSHSVRPANVSRWNKEVDRIKLTTPARQRYQSGVKGEIIAEFILPKSIPISLLWSFAWSEIRTFVVALNIATRGFIWWYVPSNPLKFYDTIRDLENNRIIEMSNGPALEIDWPRQTLTEEDLHQTITVLGYIMSIRETPQFDPLNRYTFGLTLFSKIDVHHRSERDAFLAFWMSLRDAMRVNLNWDGESDYIAAAISSFPEILSTTPEFEDHIRLGAKIENARLTMGEAFPVTLTNVIAMKSYCDFFYIVRAHEWAKAGGLKRLAEVAAASEPGGEI